MTITLEQLKHIYRGVNESKLRQWLPLLNQTMEEFDINNRQRIGMFLAQIGHESGLLRYVEEIASGQAYENRQDLGNTQAGDGVKYKGRGLIQLTGKSNYALASIALDLPLLDQPELLLEPLNAARVSGWYWKNRNLNALCDMGMFEKLTRRINGGLNGYADRVKLYHRAMEVL